MKMAEAFGSLLADQVNYGGADAVQILILGQDFSVEDYQKFGNQQRAEPLRFSGLNQLERCPYSLCEGQLPPS